MELGLRLKELQGMNLTGDLIIKAANSTRELREVFGLDTIDKRVLFDAELAEVVGSAEDRAAKDAAEIAARALAEAEWQPPPEPKKPTGTEGGIFSKVES